MRSLSASPRNTSACAEKTARPGNARTRWWKHLRLRGENLANRSSPAGCKKHLRLRGENVGCLLATCLKGETPPLARRKLAERGGAYAHGGNTSACAEKTSKEDRRTSEKQKHLRLRGENTRRFLQFRRLQETPPLARRKLPV